VHQVPGEVRVVDGERGHTRRRQRLEHVDELDPGRGRHQVEALEDVAVVGEEPDAARHDLEGVVRPVAQRSVGLAHAQVDAFAPAATGVGVRTIEVFVEAEDRPFHGVHVIGARAVADDDVGGVPGQELGREHGRELGAEGDDVDHGAAVGVRRCVLRHHVLPRLGLLELGHAPRLERDHGLGQGDGQREGEQDQDDEELPGSCGIGSSHARPPGGSVGTAVGWGFRW
jgi:hypothetical protein